jgi:hypothetical protein
LYIGRRAQNRRWVRFGVAYAIAPGVFLAADAAQVNTNTGSLLYGLVFFTWIAALVHAIRIRRDVDLAVLQARQAHRATKAAASEAKAAASKAKVSELAEAREADRAACSS